ncbi:Vacuolar fusion protein CCZ1-like protein [Diplodia seriata]|uniref:Vacuolar fusion protein CCZ1-like protein n=1 Tax=Diplodia seriata TaxID=420778 RepID=A0A1S8B6S9_9PEZI|nr:Vacuolar fusion protein CCZ1-like protein [Diplodia seriata]
MAARVVPAQLAFLAIFCPTLAANDDAFRDQLVFYHSNKATRRHDDDENERLRQIGLAQGMIDFARSFSDGEPVDHVDTEKSRIVMHELEKDWWVLAVMSRPFLPHALRSNALLVNRPDASPCCPHRPFITTMLFESRTATLSYPAFYRHLHSYLAPLHKPLTISTSPNRVAARIAASANPYSTTAGGSGPNTQPIYDLIYDPLHLTVHSSIPNIPEPGTAGAEGLGTANGATNGPCWTRVEALNVHSQILATLGSARRVPNDIERTAKTSRGWWLVWMRLPPSESVTDSMATPTSPAIPASEGRYLSGKPSASSLKHLSPSKSGHEPEEEDSVSTQLPVSHTVTDSRNILTATLREALLVRRSREAGPPNIRNIRHGGGASGSGSSLWRLGLGGGSSTAATGGSTAGWGPRGLAEGVGIDARKYIEGLLSLSR